MARAHQMGCCASAAAITPLFDFTPLLPQTKKMFKYVDLGALHLKQEPRLNTATLDGQLQLLEIACGSDTSVGTYGGFLEDHTDLWKDYYPPIDGNPTWHLGLDVNNLEAGEPVCSLTDGVIVDVYGDAAKVNGWGGRLMIRSGDRFILYGHLDFKSIMVKVGHNIKRGKVIGTVGGSETNGNWFWHVRVQCMSLGFIMSRYDGRFPDIDGYIQEEDTVSLERELIDPLTLFGAA